jgi:SET domain-containing protein
LRIKDSLIQGAGKGLFAIDAKKQPNEVIFRTNAFICKYHGERINLQTLVSRYSYNTGPYAVSLGNNMFEDGACHRGVGSIPNHAVGSTANAKFSIGRENGQRVIKLVAIKNIKNDKEILINYGRSYQLVNPNIQFQTK